MASLFNLPDVLIREVLEMLPSPAYGKLEASILNNEYYRITLLHVLQELVVKKTPFFTINRVSMNRCKYYSTRRIKFVTSQLIINQKHITEEEITALLSCISEINLLRLNINRDISNDGLLRIFSAPLNQLTTIEISNSNIMNNDTLLQIIESHPTVKIVNIYRCRVIDINNISNALQQSGRQVMYVRYKFLILANFIL